MATPDRLAAQKAMLLLALFSVYIALVGDGNTVFPTMRFFWLGSILASALLIGFHAKLLSRRTALPATEPVEGDLLLSQAVVIAALASLLPRFTRNSHVNEMLVVAAVAYLTSRAVLAGRLSLAGKIVADGIAISALGLHLRVQMVMRTGLGEVSDMLLLVDRALTRFLAGASPYTEYAMDQMAGRFYTLPLTYLPLTWGSYLPARLLSIDLRWTNVAIEMMLFAASVVLAVRLAPRAGKVALALASCATVVHLNGYLVRRVDPEIFVATFFLALVVWAFAAGRTLSGFFLLGASLACSPLTLLVIPYLTVHACLTRGARRSLAGFGLMVATAAGLIVPFWMANPPGFAAGIAGHWQMLMKYPYAWARDVMQNLNFSLLLYRYHRQDLLVYVQAGICLLFFALFLKGRWWRSFAATASFCAMTIFLFLMFNIVVWTYLYHVVLYLSLIAFAAAAWEQRPPPARRPPLRRGLAAALPVLSVLGVVASMALAPAEDPAESGRALADRCLVGAYYYVWFPGNFSQGYLRRNLDPPQTPAAGIYSSSDPAVAERHIEWCSRSGIDFLAVSWWPSRPEQNRATAEGLMKAHNLGDTKFCVVYETWNLGFERELGALVFDEEKTARLVSSVTEVADTFFSHPSYLRVAGRPVLFLYLTRTFGGDFEGAIAAVREALRRRGHDVFLIGDEVFWKVTPAAGKEGRLQPLVTEPQSGRIALFDAVTGYNLYENDMAASHKGYGKDSLFLTHAAALYRRYGDATGRRIPVIPGIIPGYNDRGVRRREDHYVLPRQWSADEGEGTFLAESFDRLAFPLLDRRLPMIMVTSFNEWNEDTAVEPLAVAPATDRDISGPDRVFTRGYRYAGYGTTYLEVIRDKVVAVAGRVVDAAGLPLRGVEVAVFSGGTRADAGVTDSDGYYRISRSKVAAGSWEVGPVTGRARKSVVVDARRTVTGVDFAVSAETAAAGPR